MDEKKWINAVASEIAKNSTWSKTAAMNEAQNLAEDWYHEGRYIPEPIHLAQWVLDQGYIHNLSKAELPNSHLMSVEGDKKKCLLHFKTYDHIYQVTDVLILTVTIEYAEFDPTEIDVELYEELDEYRIENSTLVIESFLTEETLRFNGNKITMRFTGPDTSFYLNCLEQTYKQYNTDYVQIKSLRTSVNKTKSFIEKAIDRAKRKHDFKPTSALKHEIRLLESILHVLNEKEV